MTDAKKLDLAVLFSGREFPKDTVEVFMDEKTAYDVHKLTREISKALLKEDEEQLAALEDEFAALVKKGAQSRLVVHLTGVSRTQRQVAIDEVTETYPIEFDAFGRVKHNPEADELLTNLSWKLYIEKIVGEDGSELEPELEDIILLRRNAPAAALEAIKDGMDELSEGAKGGFETIAQEHDFLSQPSPKG